MSNKFIEENIETSYILTNNTVDNIRADESFNKNPLAKALMSNVENYKRIIDKLLKDEKNT